MTPGERYEAEVARQTREFRFKIAKGAASLLASGVGLYFVSVRGGMDSATAAWVAVGSIVAGLVLGTLIILWIHNRT